MEQSADCQLLLAAREAFVELDGTREVEHPGLTDQLGVRPDGLYHIFQDRQGTRWFSSSADLARRADGPLRRLQPYGGTGTNSVARIRTRRGLYGRGRERDYFELPRPSWSPLLRTFK